MGKLKVMTIVGTRPEIIRLSHVLKPVTNISIISLYTRDRTGTIRLTRFFEDLETERTGSLSRQRRQRSRRNDGEHHRQVLCADAERPDAVLILGDTNSALSAISAKRLKIPIFHMEAGNRCWDWNVSR